jgi:hypothetical protein
MSDVLAVLLAITLAVQPAPPPIAPATIDDTLEVDGESVAARQVKTRMTVAVAVNGRGPFRFLVDSGADRSVVGAGLAAQLGLLTRGTVTLHGMAGTSRVGTVAVDRLQVGGNMIRDLSFPPCRKPISARRACSGSTRSRVSA